MNVITKAYGGIFVDPVARVECREMTCVTWSVSPHAADDFIAPCRTLHGVVVAGPWGVCCHPSVLRAVNLMC